MLITHSGTPITFHTSPLAIFFFKLCFQRTVIGIPATVTASLFVEISLWVKVCYCLLPPYQPKSLFMLKHAFSFFPTSPRITSSSHIYSILLKIYTTSQHFSPRCHAASQGRSILSVRLSVYLLILHAICVGITASSAFLCFS